MCHSLIVQYKTMDREQLEESNQHVGRLGTTPKKRSLHLDIRDQGAEQLVPVHVAANEDHDDNNEDPDEDPDEDHDNVDIPVGFPKTTSFQVADIEGNMLPLSPQDIYKSLSKGDELEIVQRYGKVNRTSSRLVLQLVSSKQVSRHSTVQIRMKHPSNDSLIDVLFTAFVVYNSCKSGTYAHNYGAF